MTEERQLFFNRSDEIGDTHSTPTNREISTSFCMQVHLDFLRQGPIDNARVDRVSTSTWA